MAHTNDRAGVANPLTLADVGGVISRQLSSKLRKDVYGSGARQDAEAGHAGRSCCGVY
jgi:hypothetical protein